MSRHEIHQMGWTPGAWPARWILRTRSTRRGSTALCIAVSVLLAAPGCALIGWNCRRGQETGPVTTLTGRVGPGDVVSLVVPYDQAGTQNDARISWPDQYGASGPRIRVYATSADCTTFTPPSELAGERDAGPPPALRQPPRTPPPAVRPSPADPCAIYSGRQGRVTDAGEFIQNRQSVAGGPEQLKPDFRQYKLHVVGDPRVETAYSIAITWFRGPDC
jgi:hypothetical protein